MPTGFDHLPPLLQVVCTMAVVIFGGTIAFTQFSKKWLDKFTPEKMKSKQAPTTDTVVISAAFADAKPVRELAEAVRAQMDGTDRFLHSIDRNTKEHARQTEAFEDLVSVARDILREVREMRHERRGH